MVKSFVNKDRIRDGIGTGTLKQIFAAWGGWLLDGYTSIAYLLVLYYLSNSIFPATLGYWRLVLTLGGGSFGAVARVFGSAFLGNFIGDKIGRKSLLTFSIVGFSVFTAAIGLVPSYQSVGLLAPVLVFVLVACAGLFAGAEYGGGASLAMESVPKEKRNFVGAFVQSGFGTGYFVVVLAYLVLLGLFGSSFAVYGWRYLFLSALIPGFLTLIVRLISHESPVFKQMKETNDLARSPAVEMLVRKKFSLVPIIMLMTGLLFINTATFSFYPVIAGFYFLNSPEYLYALLIINFVSLLGVWFGGVVLNRIPSRRRILMIFATVFTIPSALFVYFGYSSNFDAFTIAFSIQAFLEAMIFSLIPAFLSETFSKRFRTTAVGVTYNSGAILGGLALVLITLQAYFISLQLVWALNLYVAGLVMIAGLALMREPENAGKDLITD